MGLPPEGGRAEVRLARQDGSWIWVAFSTSVVADHADGPRFPVVHVNDIEQRRRRDLVMSRDPLTGLLTDPGLRLYLQRHLCPWPTMDHRFAADGW